MIRAKLLLSVLILLSGLAFAGQTCATATVAPADGRIVDFDFVGATSTNFYQFSVTGGRSYSVEVREDYDDPPSTLTVTLNSEATSCTTALAGTTDTRTTEPALPANAFRSSFTVAGTGPAVYSISVQNTGTLGRYVSVSVSETTLYCPNWTSQSPFFSAFTLANTTSHAIAGTLTLYDTSGAQRGTTPVNMPASGAALCYTAVGSSINCSNLNPIAGKTGFALLTHNGPPGAVQAEAFTQNFTFPTPFTQPLDFKPIRQSH